MSAKIHGLTSFSLIPAPDLFIARDKEGVTTATRSFTCLKSAVATVAIQSKIKKGTPITSLCSDVPPGFSALLIESNSSQDVPGGLASITIAFAGFVDEGEFEGEREITYSLRGVTQLRPIYTHPEFIEAFDGFDYLKNAMVQICLATAYAEGMAETSGQWRVYQIPTDDPLFSGWDASAERDAWWRSIVIDGDREFEAPTYEWTRTTANAGGLSGSDIQTLGRSDEPPGSPPEPDGVTGWWRLADLSDERTEGQSNNSLTWRFVEGVAKHYEQ